MPSEMCSADSSSSVRGESKALGVATYQAADRERPRSVGHASMMQLLLSSCMPGQLRCSRIEASSAAATTGVCNKHQLAAGHLRLSSCINIQHQQDW
jgi:hypothetical protein